MTTEKVTPLGAVWHGSHVPPSAPGNDVDRSDWFMLQAQRAERRRQEWFGSTCAVQAAIYHDLSECTQLWIRLGIHTYELIMSMYRVV